MTILVTGATGFIGNHVIEELLKCNHQIVATSTSVTKAAQYDWLSKVRYVPYSFRGVEDDTNLFELFGKPDLLMHLAWPDLPNYKSLVHINRNLFPQLSFITNLVHNGLKNVLVTGTCLEYGMQNGVLHEDLAPAPGNPYAIAKDSLRRFIEAMQSFYDFSFKWVRLFYMYGEGQGKNSIIPQLEKAARNGEVYFKMSGGEQLRDYLPVKEVAHYLCKIALQAKVEGIINCCSGKPVSVRRFVEEYIVSRGLSIKPLYGCYPYPDYEPMAFWGANEKLKIIIKNDKSS